MTIKVTQKLVDDLEPRDRYYRVSDITTPGLSVKVMPSGKKFYTIRYFKTGAKHRSEHTLAPTSIITLKKARELAKIHVAEILTGRGLAERPEEKEEVLTMAEVINAYKKSPLYKDKRPKTKISIDGIINRFLLPKLGNKDARSLKKADIVKFLDYVVEKSTPSVANTALAYTRVIFGFAEERDWVDRNPAKGIKKPGAQNIRDRFLKEAEIKIVLSELPEPEDMKTTEAILYLLMLTGLRVGEVLGATKDEFDLPNELWTIPGDRVKGKKDLKIPLCSEAMRIITSREPHADGRLFPTSPTHFRRLTDKIAKKCSGHFTPHDLRRTVVTTLQKLDPSLTDDMLARVLGHAVEPKGALKHYAHHEYIEERRELLKRWQSYLLSL